MVVFLMVCDTCKDADVRNVCTWTAPQRRRRRNPHDAQECFASVTPAMSKRTWCCSWYSVRGRRGMLMERVPHTPQETDQPITATPQQHSSWLALRHDVTLKIMTHRWVPVNTHTCARKGKLWVASSMRAKRTQRSTPTAHFSHHCQYHDHVHTLSHFRHRCARLVISGCCARQHQVTLLTCSELKDPSSQGNPEHADSLKTVQAKRLRGTPRRSHSERNKTSGTNEINGHRFERPLRPTISPFLPT